MERTQFTFYASYANAAKRMKATERAKYYDCVIGYALYGIEPDIDKLPDIVATAYEAVLPNLRASRRKAAGGTNKDSRKIPESSGEDTGKIPESSCEDSGKIIESSFEDTGKITESSCEDTGKIDETSCEDDDNKNKNKNKIKNKIKDKNKIKNECYPPIPPRGTSERFVPPTLEEIEAYCQERQNGVDPKRFFDYFNASGWVDSRGNKVKNWKQKIITWEGRGSERKEGSLNARTNKPDCGTDADGDKRWNITYTLDGTAES